MCSHPQTRFCQLCTEARASLHEPLVTLSPYRKSSQLAGQTVLQRCEPSHPLLCTQLLCAVQVALWGACGQASGCLVYESAEVVLMTLVRLQELLKQNWVPQPAEGEGEAAPPKAFDPASVEYTVRNCQSYHASTLCACMSAMPSQCVYHAVLRTELSY
jgi:hypothetical protein